MQTHDPAEDRFAPIPALGVLCDDARTNLDAHAEFEDAFQNGAASDAALEIVNLGTGFVDVEGTDDDQPWVGGEVSYGDGDALYDVFVDGIDVVF